MTYTLVHYNPAEESPARNGLRHFDDVTLVPGRNRLDTEKFEALSKHPQYEKFVGLGAIKVLALELSKEAEETLQTLSIKEAKVLITGEYDVAKLKKWLEYETSGKKRPAIIASINLQIGDVERGSIKDDQGDDEKTTVFSN